MFGRLGIAIVPSFPQSNVYGAARSLLAMSVGLTLLLNSPATFFREVATFGQYPICEGVASFGAFCLTGEDHLGTTQKVLGLVCLLIATGYRPRFTGVPLAYIAFSVSIGISIPDGGDQLASNLAIFFAIVSVFDSRKWHWQRATLQSDKPARLGDYIALAAIWLVQLQMTAVYLQAGIAKMGVDEWVDGSAFYYWSQHIYFGLPSWLSWLNFMISLPAISALLTWVPLLLELSLGVSILLNKRVRFRLMIAGILFHFVIGLTIGLWSFAMVMWAGLLILGIPAGRELVSTRNEAVKARGRTVKDAQSGDLEISRAG